jgi:hypothetical protein
MQDGKTPLWSAASNGHLEVVRLLVEKGVEFDRADNVRRMSGGGRVIYVYLLIYQLCAVPNISFQNLR